MLCVDAHQIPRLVVWQVDLSRVTNFRGPSGGRGVSYNGGIFLVFVKSQSKIDDPGLPSAWAQIRSRGVRNAKRKGRGQPNVKVGTEGLSISTIWGMRKVK
jgi:hypothetical protein